VTASYKVTLVDYKAALLLHRRQKLSRRLNFVLWRVVVPITAAFGALAFIVFNLSRLTRYAPLLFGIECGLAWISIYLPLWSYYSTRKCVRQIFQDQGKERIILLEVTDEFVLSTIQGVSEGKYFWNENMALVSDARVVLIYVAKKRFIPIPMRSLSESQLQELQILIQRNAAKK
jgi:hypothetical protein